MNLDRYLLLTFASFLTNESKKNFCVSSKEIFYFLKENSNLWNEMHFTTLRKPLSVENLKSFKKMNTLSLVSKEKGIIQWDYKLENIKTLILENYHAKVNYLLCFPQLDTLILKKCDSVFYYQCISNLKELQLYEIESFDMDLFLIKNPMIHKLVVQFTQQKTVYEVCKEDHYLPMLEWIELNRISLEMKSITAPYLQYVRLQNCYLHASAFKEFLCREENNPLQSICLEDTSIIITGKPPFITKEKYKHFVFSSTALWKGCLDMDHLEQYVDPNITEAIVFPRIEIPFMASLPSFIHLVRLELCSWTNEILKSLSPLKKLERFGLRHSASSITYSDLVTIGRQFRKLKELVFVDVVADHLIRLNKIVPLYCVWENLFPQLDKMITSNYHPTNIEFRIKEYKNKTKKDIWKEIKEKHLLVYKQIEKTLHTVELVAGVSFDFTREKIRIPNKNILPLEVYDRLMISPYSRWLEFNKM